MSVGDNYTEVLTQVKKAAREAGRKEDDVLLLAVSKTKPVQMLQEAYECGCRDFGENKVQELCSKYEVLPSDIRWHLIGHLQTNKVKQVIGKTVLIHSVDSVKLARVIQTESEKKNVTTDILLEVNVSGEESKFGITPSELLDIVKEISTFSRVRVRGLMTVPPICENPDENAVYFAMLRQLSVDIKAEKIDNIYMDILSMGMSDDYETAIREGSSVVRVGSRIFGHRDYSKE